jgi:succinyl-CoA synthetase beta subunit
MMASAEGGMDIEEVAARMPERIFREEIHGSLGLGDYQGRKLCALLGLPAEHHRTATGIFTGLARLFLDLDCTLAEINPLAVVKGRGVMALDAKLNFDDRALDRHPDLQALHDEHEEDPHELAATRAGLSYVSMDGNIGCMVNGAGLAMSTMDMIKHHGGAPANFLDVGGGATKEQVTTAFKLLLANAKVRAVLVNIFGGIMKCDVIAQGVIAAAREVALQVPLVVRLEGTNVEAGRRLLAESGLNLTSATDMDDAARKVVAAAAART